MLLLKSETFFMFSGELQHKGNKVQFSTRFGQGSIIGVHLDTWRGTLTFYKNRHCIGACLKHMRKYQEGQLKTQDFQFETTNLLILTV